MIDISLLNVNEKKQILDTMPWIEEFKNYEKDFKEYMFLLGQFEFDENGRISIKRLNDKEQKMIEAKRKLLNKLIEITLIYEKND